MTGALSALLALLVSVPPAASAVVNAYRQTNLVSVDQTHAILALDNSNGGSGAVYKGPARGRAGSHELLFATNFRAGTVDVLDARFAPVQRREALHDPELPAGYAPFGIQNIGGELCVTFVLQNSQKHDDVKGPGHGFVDVFDTHPPHQRLCALLWQVPRRIARPARPANHD